MRVPDDKRAIKRIECRLAVSDVATSDALGTIEDISLDGMFVATPRPWVQGTIIPVVFELAPDARVRVQAEVMRVTPRGFGARFVDVPQKEARRLRRYITEANSLADLRRSYGRARDSKTALSVDDPQRIQAIFATAVGQQTASKAFTIVAEGQTRRVEAQLEAISNGGLKLNTTVTVALKPGDPVLALHTHQFASYSFHTSVVQAGRNHLVVSVPEKVYYSERRGQSRNMPTGAEEIQIALPWRNNEIVTFPICERSDTGLSFRVKSTDIYFWPGTAFQTAKLRTSDGAITELQTVTVRHLSSVTEADGEAWLKIGVSVGVERATHAFTEIKEAIRKRPKIVARAESVIKRALTQASYLYHKKTGAFKAGERASSFTVVRFNNTREQPVVGLLNLSFSDKRRVRAPLVIISPGFAGRKETFSALAMTIVHNFRRENLDIAVLRMDGVNNLGESYKDPGCETEGKDCLKFTLSGGTSDILGAIKWAKDNSLVDPTTIILISSSFSTISARKSLTMPETADVTKWIALMGPPDGAHPVANAMGNSDPYKNYIEGVKNGTVTLFGCLSDADNVCRDMHENKLATLEDARADMALIKADCTWVIGRQDAFIDPRRVEDVMSVKAPGKREILAVDAGHLPRTSDEALKQFRLITRSIWRHLYQEDGHEVSPSTGWLASVAEQEWRRVRRARLTNATDYWTHYLLGDGAIGYDVWSLTDEYQQLMGEQARLLQGGGKHVLDLGAGTGNASAAVAATHPASITAVDLVEAALERTSAKVAPHGINLKTVVGSVDGNLRIAVRRWLNGDMRTIGAFVDRMPAEVYKSLKGLPERYTDELHGILRGNDGDVALALERAALNQSMQPHVADLQTLAQWERGALKEPDALKRLGRSWHGADVTASGLAFADNFFDRIICSLVLSYLRHPEDALAEMYRVLKPGGLLLVSTMKPDAEGSQTYLNAINKIKAADASTLPVGYSRESLLDATHKFLDRASDLVRLEEEGIFQFWSGPQLRALALRAGFVHAEITESFGSPAQAVIVTCHKP